VALRIARTTFEVSTESTPGRDAKIDTVDFVFEIAVVIFKAPHHGIQRRDDHVIPIQSARAFGIGISTCLRGKYANDLEPHVVDFYVIANTAFETE
jgi:hypothetical protein